MLNKIIEVKYMIVQMFDGDVTLVSKGTIPTQTRIYISCVPSTSIKEEMMRKNKKCYQSIALNLKNLDLFVIDKSQKLYG
jgi:hypothetical protein